MTIKFKLVAVLTILLGLFALTSAVTLLNLRDMQPKLEDSAKDASKVVTVALPLLLTIKEIKVDVIQVQQWITNYAATRAQDGLNDGLDVAAEYAEKFKNDVAAARVLARQLEAMEMGMEHGSDGEKSLTQLLDQIEAEFGPYHEAGRRMGQTYAEYGPSEGNKMMNEFDAVAEKIGETTDQLVAEADEHTKTILTGLEGKMVVMRDANAKLSSWIIFLTIAGLAIAVAAAVFLYRAINNSMAMLQRDIGTLSNFAADTGGGGEGALDLKLEEQRRDEFGAVAGALHTFEDYIRKGKQLAAEQLGQQEAKVREAERLEKLFAGFGKGVTKVLEAVASSATELEQTAQQMSATAEQATGQASAVATASNQATANVQTVATAAEEMSASIAEIGRQVGQSARIAQNAVEEAENTNKTVLGLSEAAGKIGEVVTLINDIAGQTNLLALNATIEAARAGEAGKGFAVVAQEVKNLANQTAKATEEISTQIGAVQEETEGAVTAIEKIRSIIGEINDISTTIASAVEEQGVSTEEIARNVQQAAQGTSEVNTNITGVTEAASQTGAAATQVLASSGELSRQAETLRGQVDEFLREVKSA